MTPDLKKLLEPIKERLKAATPGKWITGKSPNCTSNASCLTVWSHDKRFYEHKIVECVLVGDAELIAYAPQDLSRLIEAVEVAMDGLERYKHLSMPQKPGIDGLHKFRPFAREAIEKVREILEAKEKKDE